LHIYLRMPHSPVLEDELYDVVDIIQIGCSDFLAWMPRPRMP